MVRNEHNKCLKKCRKVSAPQYKILNFKLFTFYEMIYEFQASNIYINFKLLILYFVYSETSLCNLKYYSRAILQYMIEKAKNKCLKRYQEMSAVLHIRKLIFSDLYFTKCYLKYPTHISTFITLQKCKH